MQWKRVPTFDLYEVNDLGQIRNRYSRHIKATRPCSRSRYRLVSLMTEDGAYITVHVGRVVCAAWHGPPPSPEHEAAHDDGDPGHNAPANLAWKTSIENKADRDRHGTTARGERAGQAKLTTAQVLEIRADPRGCAEIAPAYGVTPQAIRAVKQRRVWRHVA